MGYTQAIGRRHRVIRRANARAQARFHAAFDAGVITDETARATILYVEAERLIDRLIAPEVPPTPVAVLELAIARAGSFRSDNLVDPNESAILAAYWNRSQ